MRYLLLLLNNLQPLDGQLTPSVEKLRFTGRAPAPSHTQPQTHNHARFGDHHRERTEILDFPWDIVLWWGPAEPRHEPTPEELAARFAKLQPENGDRLLPEEGDRRLFSPEGNKRRIHEVNRALLELISPSIPSGWAAPLLTLDVSYKPAEHRYLVRHQLQDEATGAKALDFSDEVLDVITVLRRVHYESAMPWQQCAVRWRRTPDGGLEKNLTFTALPGIGKTSKT